MLFILPSFLMWLSLDMLDIPHNRNDRREYTFLNLSPGVTYTVSIETVAVDGGRAFPISVTVTTCK